MTVLNLESPLVYNGSY